MHALAARRCTQDVQHKRAGGAEWLRARMPSSLTQIQNRLADQNGPTDRTGTGSWAGGAIIGFGPPEFGPGGLAEGAQL